MADAHDTLARLTRESVSWYPCADPAVYAAVGEATARTLGRVTTPEVR